MSEIISSGGVHIIYRGDGSSTVFPVPFPVDAGAECLNLYVAPAVSSGAAVRLPGSAFSYASGAVTLTFAPAASETLAVVRETPASRRSIYAPGGPLTARSLNADLDRIMYILQELRGRPAADWKVLDPDLDLINKYFTSYGGSAIIRDIVSSGAMVTNMFLQDKALFEIFPAATTEDPPGAMKLDGSVLSDCDDETSPYHEFFARALELGAAGKIRVVTQEQYAETLGQYGQCGAFVVDEIIDGRPHCIKLPTVRSFIQNVANSNPTNSGGTIGTVHRAGVPNITGQFPNGDGDKLAVEHQERSAYTELHSGAFHMSGGTQYSDYLSGGNFSYASHNVADLWGRATFDASRCNSAYGAAETVQPESVEMCFFIQVANIRGKAIEGVAPNPVAVIVTNDDHSIAGDRALYVQGVQVDSGGKLTSSGGTLTHMCGPFAQANSFSESGPLPAGGDGEAVWIETASANAASGGAIMHEGWVMSSGASGGLPCTWVRSSFGATGRLTAVGVELEGSNEEGVARFRGAIVSSYDRIEKPEYEIKTFTSAPYHETQHEAYPYSATFEMFRMEGAEIESGVPFEPYIPDTFGPECVSSTWSDPSLGAAYGVSAVVIRNFDGSRQGARVNWDGGGYGDMAQYDPPAMPVQTGGVQGELFDVIDHMDLVHWGGPTFTYNYENDKANDPPKYTSNTITFRIWNYEQVLSAGRYDSTTHKTYFPFAFSGNWFYHYDGSVYSATLTPLAEPPMEEYSRWYVKINGEVAVDENIVSRGRNQLMTGSGGELRFSGGKLLVSGGAVQSWTNELGCGGADGTFVSEKHIISSGGSTVSSGVGVGLGSGGLTLYRSVLSGGSAVGSTDPIPTLTQVSAMIGSGGAGGMIVVDDDTTTSAYIPVLSGGTCYRYDQPLTTLSIGSVADTPAEDTIIFSAGAVITPPVSMTVWVESNYFDHDQWVISVGSKELKLVSSGGSYTLDCGIPDGIGWSFADGGMSAARVWLQGGRFGGVSSGGSVVVSAYDVMVLWESAYYDAGEDDYRTFYGSSALNGLVASSGDGGATWTFGGIYIPSYVYDDNIGEIAMHSGTVCSAVAEETVVVCPVVLPSGTELVGSSRIALESGHKYEMNIANGGIVMAERFAQEKSE